MKKISIHAPAKGATFRFILIVESGINFNPRSREGSDKCAPSKRFFMVLFQSTLPRRERLIAAAASNDSISISIHAPAKGATVNFDLDHGTSDISIHAPAKGATIFNSLTG